MREQIERTVCVINFKIGCDETTGGAIKFYDQGQEMWLNFEDKKEFDCFVDLVNQLQQSLNQKEKEKKNENS